MTTLSILFWIKTIFWVACWSFGIIFVLMALVMILAILFPPKFYTGERPFVEPYNDDEL